MNKMAHLGILAFSILEFLSPSISHAQLKNFWGNYDMGSKSVVGSTRVAPERSYFLTEVEEAPGGFKLIVDIYNGELRPGEVEAPVSLDLQVAINDGHNIVQAIPVAHLSDAKDDNPTKSHSRREFILTYQQLNDSLSKILPAAAQHLKIGPGSALFVIGKWPKWGHTWGGLGRGGIFYTPEISGQVSAEALSSENTLKNRHPEELDLAYPIPSLMTIKYNHFVTIHTGEGYYFKINKGLKQGGQIRSRLEKEGKFQVPLNQADDVKKKLFEMANDPAAAARVLGPDWTIAAELKYMKKDSAGNLLLDEQGLPTPDPMVDTYYDNEKMDAAKNDIAIRYRWTEQNGTGAWNIKPGGGHTSADGAVSRIEYGVDTTDDKPDTVKTFANSSDPLNPFRSIREVIPGAVPSDFLKPALKITDTRFKFKLRHTNGLVIEISLDQVIAQSLRNSNRGRYVQLEMDVDHLSTTSANVARLSDSFAYLSSILGDAEKRFADGLTADAYLDGRPVIHTIADLNQESPVMKKHGPDFQLAETAIVAIRDQTLGHNWLPAPQKASLAALMLGSVRPAEAAPSVQSLMSKAKALTSQGLPPGSLMQNLAPTPKAAVRCQMVFAK